MASPIVALRFRETTPGVDTIAEHIKLIDQSGFVWWGWWKKETEDSQDEMLARVLPKGGQGNILLVDRSTSRMWSALCTGWTSNRPDVPAGSVPEYYRIYIPNIATFFRLKAIESVPYDEAVGNALLDRTIWEVGKETVGSQNSLALAASAGGRSCVLHLSDLHFGKDYGFKMQGEVGEIGDTRTTLTDCLVKDLERIGLRDDVAAVIVTGDFITAGDWKSKARSAALAEFDALRQALGINRNQIVAVPGNHDIVRYPEGHTLDVADQAVQNQTNVHHEREFRMFVDELVERGWRENLNYIRRVRLQSADLDICVLNSCTITATKWTEYGYVGTNGIDLIQQLNAQPVERPTFRFLALHHHLLPVADIEAPNSKGVSLTLDASKLLEEAQQAGVQVALHGHQHIPKITRYQNVPLRMVSQMPPVHIVSNGSTGAKRLLNGERNTYCIFKLSNAGLDLHLRELRPDAVVGMSLFEGGLNIAPISP